MTYTAAVITVSDSTSMGQRTDTSGPAICSMLKEAGYSVVHTAIVPDDIPAIRAELTACADEKQLDLIITTGGIGLSPRDVPPEATLAIPVAMWMEGLKHTPCAMLSRAVAGTRGHSLILNLPDSEKAARENLSAVIATLEHALRMMAAEGH